MKRIEIGVISPKEEQQALMEWAARVDAGEAVPEGISKLNFVSFRQLHATLTEKRMELLERSARQDGLNIRQLAQELGRNYRNVYDDVQMLVELGLLEKRDGKLYAPYDEIVTRYALRHRSLNIKRTLPLIFGRRVPPRKSHGTADRRR